MKRVPKLKRKKRYALDPDSLAAALNWDRLADPDNGQAKAASEGDYAVARVTSGLGAIDNDIDLGGPGSGNWAHRGRPGKIGGSQPRKSGMTIAKGKDWLERYKKAAGHAHVYEKSIAKDKKTKEKKRPRKPGDYNKRTMRELYDGATKRAQELAKKTGVLALDKATEDYVASLERAGHLADRAKVDRFSPLGIVQKAQVDRLVKDARSGCQWGFGDLEEGLKNGDGGELVNVVREAGYAVTAGKHTHTFDGFSKAEERMFKEMRDDYKNFERRFSTMPKAERQRYADVAATALFAARLNDRTNWMYGGKDIFNVGDVPHSLKSLKEAGPTNVRLMATRIRNNALTRLSRSAKGNSYQVSNMVALRQASKADADAQKARISQTWDRRAHRFGHQVHGVYEVVPQKEVRDSYAQLEASRNHVMYSAYHGTHFSAAKSISANGFTVPKTAKTGRMLGDGVYLAANSSKSMQYVGDSYGRHNARGVLLVVDAARGRQVRWNGSSSRRQSGDTVYAAKGTMTSWGRALLNDEYVVKDPQGVLPRFWIDCERK